MSLLNSVFYTTVDDLLLNRINLAYLDTAMATAGAYVRWSSVSWRECTCRPHMMLTTQEVMSSSLKAQYRQAHLPEATAGDYCRIGELIPGSTAEYQDD